MYQLIYEIRQQLRVIDRRVKRLLDLHEEGCHGGCNPEEPVPPPPPPVVQAYGYAYNSSTSSESGVVKLQVAGPLQDVDLTPNGLSIGKSGVYQISYSVSLKSQSQTAEPAIFQIEVNDSITIASSKTESSTTQQIYSNLLFSLVEGDVVKLVANIPQGMSYTLSSLQVVQVG